MSDKKIQMTQRNSDNTAWDNIYPATTGAQVVLADGSTAENHAEDNTRHITAAERAAWNAKQASLGYTPLNRGGDAMTGVLNTVSNTSQSMTDALQKPLTVHADWNHPAAITLIRDGSFAAHLGLDTDNQLKWGGWSLGSLYRILDQRDYDALFQYANDGKTAVASAITAKGVSASSGDTFASLASKIGQITIESLGGRNIRSGTVSSDSNGNITVSGLPFTPSYIIVKGVYSGTSYFNIYPNQAPPYYIMTSAAYNNYQVSSSVMSVSGGGFTCKGYNSSVATYTWVAIE